MEFLKEEWYDEALRNTWDSPETWRIRALTCSDLQNADLLTPLQSLHVSSCAEVKPCQLRRTPQEFILAVQHEIHPPGTAPPTTTSLMAIKCADVELGTHDTYNHYKRTDTSVHNCIQICKWTLFKKIHGKKWIHVYRCLSQCVCLPLCEPYLSQHDEAHKEREEADPEEKKLPAVFTSEQSRMHVNYCRHEALNTHELMGQKWRQVRCDC